VPPPVQPIGIGSSMHLSRYVKVFPCSQSADHRILFSTRKVSKIRIPPKTLERMERGALSPLEMEKLSALGFLTSDDEMEREAVCTLFPRLNAKNAELELTIFLNLDCNFSCRYCYEGAPSGDRYMTPRTADQVMAFVKDRFGPEKTSLRLNFYGGEPLLSLSLIPHFAVGLKAFTDSRGAAFSFSLVTNGSLFNRPVAQRLIALGLQSVKITLDGPAAVHDRYRPFKSGAGSFEVLMRNIRETSDLTQITIGGNYDQETWPQFVSLLDRLDAEGLTPERLTGIKFDPILRPSGQAHLLAKYHGGCVTANEPWAMEAAVKLREAILSRGYRTLKVMPIMCAIENEDALMVTVDGKLYKCPAFADREAFAIGDVSTGIRDYRETYRLDLWKNETCLSCAYLPLCYGGCRYIASRAGTGAIDAVVCRKAYFDAVLGTLVKQDITWPQAPRARSDPRTH
jgi:uncharacterized protein